MKKKKKGSRGFTLVELVIVIAIVTILSAIAVPLLINYVRTAQMTKYNDYAKTIFLSTQSYLSDKKNAGKLSEVDKGSAVTQDMIADTGVTGGKDYYGGDGTRYLMLYKKGTDQPALTKMLKNYVGDPSILEESVCVEYNPKEGVVYSVSYSESVDGFFYDTAKEKDGKQVSISNRNASVRDKLRFGYYAAKVPEAANRPGTLKASKMELVNDDKLYAKWTDAQPGTSSPDAAIGAQILYTITVYDQTTNKGKPILSFTVDSKKIKQYTPGQGSDIVENYLISCPTTYYKADGSKGPVKDVKHWIYYTYNTAAAKREYAFVIDSIDTSANVKNTAAGADDDLGAGDYSVLKKYAKNKDADDLGEIGERDIKVGLEVSSPEYRPSMVESISNTENTLFAKAKTQIMPNNPNKGYNIEVANARHLYNIRYENDAQNCFTQKKDISWKGALTKGAIVCDGTIMTESKVFTSVGSGVVIPEKEDGTYVDSRGYAFSALTFRNQGGQVSSFEGTYDGAGKGIDSLYLTAGYQEDKTTIPSTYKMSGPAGLFASNAGVVQNLKMSNVTVRGAQPAEEKKIITSTGTVAAVNEEKGIIQNVAVGYVNKINGKDVRVPGGLVTAGKKVQNTIPSYASDTGGLVGENIGSIMSCTTDTVVEGGSNVGGLVGANNNQNNNKGTIVGTKDAPCKTTGGSVTGTGGTSVGGIVGYNGNQDLKIEDFENHAVVTANAVKAAAGAAELKGGTDAGGIVGTTASGTIKNCSNFGQVNARQYAGGIIGSNKAGTIENCSNAGLVWATEAYGGGITGANGTKEDKSSKATIKQCESKVQTSLTDEELLKLATGDYVGGITGYNNGAITVNNAGSPVGISSVVMGRNYVGGVAGHNDTYGYSEYYQLVGGRVIATQNFVGGFYGLNTVRGDRQEDGKEMSFYSEPDRIIGQNYIGGVIGANLVLVSDKEQTLTITNTSKGGRDRGTVNANAFAGGVIGYNGVIKETAGINQEEQLEQALQELILRNPFTFVPADDTTSSAVTTLIQSSTSNLNITAKRFVGGIVGLNSDASKLTVKDCVNYGNLEVVSSPEEYSGENYYIGGITGRNSAGGVIDHSINSGNVKSLSKYTGGLTEVNEGRITNCSNNGTITSNVRSADGVTGNVGGITGLNGQSRTGASGAVLEACQTSERSYVTGAGMKVERLGALAGENRAVIQDINAGTIGMVGAANAKAAANYVGGIVGYNTGTGILKNIKVSAGSVAGSQYVGGLVGFSESSLGGSSLGNSLESSVTVIGSEDVGGILGGFASFPTVGTYTLEDAVNQGTVAGMQAAGGIIGRNAGGNRILNCVNSGNVSTSLVDAPVGGIAATNKGHIENCKTTGGIISGSTTAGGLIGSNEAQGVVSNAADEVVVSNATIRSDTKTGGAHYIGGLMGLNRSEKQQLITNVGVEDVTVTYGSSALSYGVNDASNPAKQQYAGGIIGYNRAGDEISKVRFTGTIEGGNLGTGGIAGKNDGIISNITMGVADGEKAVVSSTGISGGFTGISTASSVQENLQNGSNLQVKGMRWVGGYYGKYERAADADAVFSGMINQASVTGDSLVGGLAGEISSGVNAGTKVELIDCKNQGTVTGKTGSNSNSGNNEFGDTDVGGVVALIQNCEVKITGCQNLGTVDGKNTKNTGGIIGRVMNANTSNYKLTLENCSNQAAGIVKSTMYAAGGVIGKVRTKAEITGSKNMGTVSSTNMYTGGIGGKAQSLSADNGGIKISGCTNEGSVSGGGNYIGGIIGYSASVAKNEQAGGRTVTIDKCQNEGEVTGGGMYMGGITGEINGVNSSVTNSSNEEFGSVIGKNTSVGGIAGLIYDGSTVSSCTNNGSVASTKNMAGGIVGRLERDGIIRDCENKAGVSSSASYVGGIVGVLGGTGGSTNGNVINCTNSGTMTVTGGSYIGGIIGSGTAYSTATVSDCTNKGTITMNGTGNSQVGGIAGSLEGNYTVTKGSNAMTSLSAKGGRNVGGIVGLWKGNGEITDCINTAALTLTSATKETVDNAYILGGVGGMVGATSTQKASLKVSDCVNRGTISASAKLDNNQSGIVVGGILGRGDASTITFTACRNEGLIENGQSGTEGSEGMGGIAGSLMNVAGTMERCLNYQSLEPKLTESKLGGLIGAVQGRGDAEAARFRIIKSANYGAVTKNQTTGKTVCGGIVGELSQYAAIEYSYNFGTITANTESAVGGIAGTANHRTALIRRSVNSADLEVQVSSTVGGVVGSMSGQVISCQNTRLNVTNDTDFDQSKDLTKEMKEVFKEAMAKWPKAISKEILPDAGKTGTLRTTGAGNVGGIVGRTFAPGAGTLSYIGSETSDATVPAYDITKNTMKITKAGNVGGTVGGIVGHLWGGSIVKAYNTGEINITSTVNAGGIAGSIQKTDDSTSTIAGAFHFGTITGVRADNSEGGIAGTRLPKDYSLKAKPSVKDSYYMAGSVPETTVNGEKGEWRIGNESDPYRTKETANDVPTIKEDEKDKIISDFSKDGFGAMAAAGTPAFKVPEGFDYTNVEEAGKLIEEYLKTYLYTLDAPDITSVEMNAMVSNAYTVNWTGGQGNVKAYQLHYTLYQPDGTTPVTGGDLVSGEIPVTQNRQQGRPFEDKYVGYLFKVGIEAIGKENETNSSEVNYYKNEDGTDKLFMILPKMLQPTLTPDPPTKTEAQTFRFEIDAAPYLEKGKPDQDLNALLAAAGQTDLNRLEALGNRTHPDAKYYKEAYENYGNEKGLSKIYMYVGTDTTPVELTLKDGKYVATHYFDLGSEASKTFDLRFVAVPETKPMPAYCVSEWKTKLYVDREYPLQPPLNLEWKYSGTLEDANYTVSFDGVPHGKDYQMVIKCEGAVIDTRTITGVGETHREVILGTELFKDRLGKTITVEMTSLGYGAVYKDSETASTTTFPVVTRLEPPVFSVERMNDLYKVLWTGAGGQFEVQVTQTDQVDGTKKTLLEGSTDVKFLEVDYTEKAGMPDTNIVNGFYLNAEGRQIGVLGQTLNSIKQSMPQYLVYQRLPAVGMPILSGTGWTYTFDWSDYLTEHPEVTEEYCAGYQIYAVEAGIGKVPKLIGTKEGAGAYQDTALTYTFERTDAGKTMGIYVIAVGKEGYRSNSVRGTEQSIILPKPPATPKDVTVVPEPVTEMQTKDAFEAQEYQVSWKKPTATDAVITAYNLEIVTQKEDGSTEVLKGPDGKELKASIPAAQASEFQWPFYVSADYAGQKVTARVQSATTTGVVSEWAVKEVQMPVVTLETVTNLTAAKQLEDAGNPDHPEDTSDDKYGYEVSFTGVQYASKYKVEIWDASVSADAPPLYTSEVTEAGEGEKTHHISAAEAEKHPGLSTAEALRVTVTAEGDTLHYADGQPVSVTARNVMPFLTAEPVKDKEHFRLTWVPDASMEADQYRIQIIQYKLNADGKPERGELLNHTYGSSEPEFTAKELIFDYSAIVPDIPDTGCTFLFLLEQIDILEPENPDSEKKISMTATQKIQVPIVTP